MNGRWYAVRLAFSSYAFTFNHLSHCVRLPDWQAHCNSSWRTVTWFKSGIKCP